MSDKPFQFKLDEDEAAKAKHIEKCLDVEARQHLVTTGGRTPTNAELLAGHQGAAAYKRVVDVNALLKEGTLSLDEARHHALHDLKRALETPRFPDAAAKSLYRSIALEDRRHA